MKEKPTYEELELHNQKLEEENEKLREENRLLRIIFDSIPDTIGIQFPDHNILHLNQAGYDFFGLDDSQRIDKKCFELLGRSAPCDPCSTSEVLRTKKVTEHEEYFPELNKYLNCRAIPIFNQGGDILYVTKITRDISKSKQIEKEKAQAQSEMESKHQEYIELYNQIRSMTDNVPDLIWAKDLQNRYIFANKAICKKLLMCSDTEEPIGKNDLFFAEKERAAGYIHTFGEICLNSDEVVKQNRQAARFLEDGLVRGQYLALDVHKAPYYNPQGEFVGTVGAGRDVTEDLLRQKVLKESEEKFRVLAEEAPVSIMHFDANGYISFVNNWHINVFARGKLDKEFFLNKRVSELPGLKSAMVTEELEKILLGETIILDQVYTPKFAAGHEGYQSIKGVPIYQDVEIIGGILIREDVTARIKTEIELRKSEARYRGVVEDQTELICRFSPDFKLTFVNKAYCKYFGQKEQELIGTNLISLIPEEDQPKVKEHILSLSVGNRVVNYEHKIKASNGEIRWHSWIVRGFLNSEDKIYEFQGVGRDITEEKSIKERLKASVQEKETLIQEVHHRVKNNLQVISSLINMTGRRTKSEEASRICADLGSKILSMALVHNQLFSSRDKSSINLASHIQQLWNKLVSIHKATDIYVQFDLDSINISLDKATPFGLVINEMFSNIFKHAFSKGEKGKVEISLKKKLEGQLEVHVVDYGQGLPDDIDTESKNNLGLWLIQNLVQNQLKGEVSIHSERGTSIKFNFIP